MLTFVIFLAAVVFAALYTAEKTKVGKLKRFQNLEHELNALKKDYYESKKNQSALEAEIETLKPFRTIRDIEAECTKKIEENKEKITSAKAISENNFRIAAEAARKLILNAEEEAKRIAGSALEALRKASTLENTAKAMKNIIEGYGDQYLKLSTSLLDQLGEEYSHNEGGSELKKARTVTKALMKNGAAATCDYVEANRKETAINFVIDAFNGKVDSILSNVKDDNFGTLEQKLKDAFETVNFNGSAFRNARINPEFLAARIDELKWAATVQALKEKDREEQKAIREQIRDEEKAAREIEKAIKEASKEEDTLRKAMEKVRTELQGANEQQKIEYEAKLAQYEAKFKEVEEKNQRALSMAQQTKRGHVYIISNVGSFGESVFKIGVTRRLDWQDRIDELGDASVPFEFDVHGILFSEDAPALEKALHNKFDAERLNIVNSRKEFFRTSLTEIKGEIEKMQTQMKWVRWTEVAHAQEYRESEALRTKETKKAA